MTPEELPERPPQELEQSDLVAFLLPEALKLLENDFSTSGLELRLSGKIIGDIFDLRDLIAPLIDQLGGPGDERFYRLMYRADIPESRIRDVLSSGPEKPFSEKVAELLIIRALQKAFFSLKYKP